MARLLLAAVCISLLVLATFADIEHEEHGHGHDHDHDDHHHHHHDHDGHDHHDHEAHKNLFTGGIKMKNEEEEQEQLRFIAMKIDADQNGKISREEMRNYIEQRMKEQHVREADDFISTLDPSKTNKISFQSYTRDNYGDLNLNELEKKDKSDLRSRETRRNYLSDKAKWTHLDEDGDQYLTYEQFRKFLRPEDHEDLRKLEITSILTEYDDNNDGKISNDEYLKMTEAESGTAESLGEELDTNKDGFGDYEEFARYYLPTLSSAADEETDHLLKECDTDNNGYCTSAEIVDAYSSFAGSQITDFGADLEKKVEL
ncbi:unnamed protein product [Adineta ricciae]|uniref:EF-hand domain-containing protein n=1 Tax=Adineta ricciae TaxID=249248 RepID=A0A814GF49_ADIRI|nr:unnamed protein product [Adineta ricciae]CAF1000152.1 unnamed protein product [Adineta ricciae]